jgi:hypothetical protein
MPIKSADGDSVLGTFGTYYRDVREPTNDESDAVRRLSAVAAEALEREPYTQ